MTAMSNSHLVLYKETYTLKNKTSIKHLIKIIHLGAINCPAGRNGFNKRFMLFRFMFIIKKI